MNINFQEGPVPFDANVAIRHNTNLADVRSVLISKGFAVTDVDQGLLLATRGEYAVAILEGGQKTKSIEALATIKATCRILIHGAQT